MFKKNSNKILIINLLFLILLFSINFVHASSQKYSVNVTNEHPFLLSDGEYVPASKLQEGMELKTINGKKARITKITDVVLDSPVPVYNLETKLYSNFILPGGVVVHNSNLPGWTKEKLKKILVSQDPRFANPLSEQNAEMMAEAILSSSAKEGNQREILLKVIKIRRQIALNQGDKEAVDLIDRAIDFLEGRSPVQIPNYSPASPNHPKYKELYEKIIKNIFNNQEEKLLQARYRCKIFREVDVNKDAEVISEFRKIDPSYYPNPSLEAVYERPIILDIPIQGKRQVIYKIVRFVNDKGEPYLWIQHLRPEDRVIIPEYLDYLWDKVLKSPDLKVKAEYIAKYEYWEMISNVPNRGGAFCGDVTSLMLQKESCFPLRSNFRSLDWDVLSMLEDDYVRLRVAELMGNIH